MRLPELLAPAGSMECLAAAANAGADAVYMGGTRFGARAYADNPDTADFLKALDYMHLLDKKIYLTLNTLIKDSEMPDIYGFLKPLYENGLDGVIVQDAGVIRAVSVLFPDLPIHLSTQMTINSAEAAETVRALGREANITRVVPSRELGLDEIRRFREGTDLEIECFIHGALCYCYSGKCLMSSMFGGRSGNRGKCAQPCRLEYTIDGKRKFYLSPKDSCTVTIIPDLVEAGIDSFKIEGRMKGPGYVAGVTEGYRRVLDKYGELGKTGYREYEAAHPEFTAKIEETMAELYNRGGFCHGFYDMGACAGKMSIERSNHYGVKVGTVENSRGITAVINLTKDVNPQDILEIRDKGRTLYDFTLGSGARAGTSIKANFKSGSGVLPENEVFRTRNNLLLESLQERYVRNGKKTGICGRLVFRTGEDAALTLKCRNTAVTVKAKPPEAAKNSPMTEENLREKLLKTGDTPFEFQKLEIDTDGRSFMPVRLLNDLRREALDELEKAMLSGYRRKLPDIDAKTRTECSKVTEAEADGEKNGHIRIQLLITAENQLEPALKSAAEDIFIDMTDIDPKKLDDMCDTAADAGKRVYIALPRICRTDTLEKLSKHSGSLRNPFVSGYLLRNLDPYLFIVDIASKDGKELFFDHDIYVFNKEARKFYEYGCDRTTAPLELSGRELAELDVTGMILPVYGRMPIMTTANCQFRIAGKCGKDRDGAPMIIHDRMNKEMLHLAHCNYCFATIHNSDTYTLAGNLNEVRKMNPFGVRLEFYRESAEEMKKAIAAFEREWFEGEEPDKAFLYRKTAGAFKRGTE